MYTFFIAQGRIIGLLDLVSHVFNGLENLKDRPTDRNGRLYILFHEDQMMPNDGSTDGKRGSQVGEAGRGKEREAASKW